MPTYTYKCANEKCSNFNEHFDVRQRMSDDKLVTCEECSSDTLERVINNTNQTIFKGGGWVPKRH